MKDLYKEARALYLEAFPDEDAAFLDALFAANFPHNLVATSDHGRLVSMLFSIPYELNTSEGTIPARYLYAVATARDYRGQGHAKRLLAEVASRGEPVFLRPLSPSLFNFYKSAGFVPFSPHAECHGAAAADTAADVRALTASEYLAVRDTLTSVPRARMSEKFLSLAFTSGGALAARDNRFAALYEWRGDTVLFKEWLGEREQIAQVAAFLGAARYEARYADPTGTPFGVGIGVPEDTLFLAALD